MKQDLSKAYLFLSGFQVVLGAAVTYYSRSMAYYTREGPGPGFFPFWTGLLLSGLGLILGVKSFISLRRIHDGVQPLDHEPLFSISKLKNVAIVIGCLGICIILLKPVGVTIAISLFSLLLLRTVGEWGWMKSALFSGILGVGLFWVFKVWLSIPLPVGFWGF